MRGRNVFIAGAGNSAGADRAAHGQVGSPGDHSGTRTVAGRQHVRLPHPPDRRHPERGRLLPRTGGRRHRHRPSRVVVLEDTTSGTRRSVPADALFVLIGSQPRTEWLGENIARDQRGFILTGGDLPARTGHHWPPHRPPPPLETSLPGVFAAGTYAADRSNGSPPRQARARPPSPWCIATCTALPPHPVTARRRKEFDELRADRDAGYEWLPTHDEDWRRALGVQAALWRGGQVRAVGFPGSADRCRGGAGTHHGAPLRQ